MNLVDYQDSTIPLNRVKQLLSYAVGTPTEEKIKQILDQVYAVPNTTLYVWSDKIDTALGIVGFRRVGDSAEILHIAVDEKNRRQGIGRKIIDKLLALEKLKELVAETDHNAVEFYRHYGFSINSLGEKYPGVERFYCRIELSV